jgi:hypothetical protein
VVDAMGTYNWTDTDAMGTSRWWILAAFIVDSIVAARSGQLDATDVLGISSWRVADTVGPPNGGSLMLWGAHQ